MRIIPPIRLADDWRAILSRAWSVRLIVLAGVLSGIEVIMPALSLPYHSLITFCVVAAAFVSRIIAQRGLAG